ncbi:MAG TPA: orotate phosphoribosyltransferase [Bacteroidota bacterium]|nr:orotate phosphoribosyltransferase [Bacteroidota bacterium]
MKLPNDDILRIFRETNALLDGHFLLTSGLHSPHYFQCAKVLQHPKYLHLLAGEIAKHFGKSGIELVISPAIGGIVVGTEVGRMLEARTIFAERENNVMTLRRGFEIMKGERVLVVEDVVTTGGSVKEIIGLVERAGAVLAGVGYIVDRSSGKTTFNAESFSVLQMDVVTYAPDACPLCKEGTPAIKPGSRK